MVWSNNPHDEESEMYSNLNFLESFRSAVDGKLFMKLCYPTVTWFNDGESCNEWKQISNPTQNYNITGFEEVSTAFLWIPPDAGLALSSADECFIDSSPDNERWFFCVGVFEDPEDDGYWPGPEDFVNKVELYACADNTSMLSPLTLNFE